MNTRKPLFRIAMPLLLTLAALSPLANAAKAKPAKSMLGNAAQGLVSFKQYCTGCHGDTGGGDGPAAVALTPKPRNLQDFGYMSKVDDAALLKVIAEGGAAVGKSPLMAAWKSSLSEAQVKDVAAYVRSLSKK